MICCDTCEEWYHFGCINLDPAQASDDDTYTCLICMKQVEEPSWHIKKLAKKRKRQNQELKSNAKRKSEENPIITKVEDVAAVRLFFPLYLTKVADKSKEAKNT